MLFAKSSRCIPKPQSVQLFGQPIQWVDGVRYLGVTLIKAHLVETYRSGAEAGRSDLSISNGVLLYKQLIRPMMDYVCPIWRSATRSHIKKLQVLQSKCLRIATNAPWFFGNRQIHDDLGVHYF